MFRHAEAEITPGWAARDQEMTLGIRQGVNAGLLGDFDFLLLYYYYYLLSFRLVSK